MRNSILVFILFLAASCAIEEARPQKEKQLTLAHNFMSAAQKKIVFKIAKRRHIDLKIVALSPSFMRKAIKNRPWEPGFDLILLDGIKGQKVLENSPLQYHEAAFAAIPIGVSYVPDSIVQIRHFNDLSAHYLWAAADDQSQTVLQANMDYTYRNRQKNTQLQKIYKALWRGFKDHKLAFDNYHISNTLLLCRYDTYLQKLKPLAAKRRFTFALNKKGRYYADYMSLSIVAQSPQYSSAKKFVRYLHYLRNNNASFRNAFGMAAPQKTAKQPTVKVLLEYLEK